MNTKLLSCIKRANPKLFKLRLEYLNKEPKEDFVVIRGKNIPILIDAWTEYCHRISIDFHQKSYHSLTTDINNLPKNLQENLRSIVIKHNRRFPVEFSRI